MPELITAYLALGSNLGDRRAFLDQALALLRLQPGIRVIKTSSYHETKPVGGPPGQGDYLNAVAQIDTTLEAPRLLRVLQGIETQLGRERGERFGPRTLDLDLLLYGLQILNREKPEGLEVPHPRLHERLFVLEPLVEIAPLAVHPLLQSTAWDLYERCRQKSTSPLPQRDLTGQTAVVTGSTSGIGKAIALALAEAGAQVIIHGRRSREAAEKVADQCRTHQVQTAIVMADLREEAACTHLVEQAWQQCSAIDIWINNAGADTLTGEAADWPFERKLQEIWAVDVRATMQLARAAGQRMKMQGRGVILTMGWDQAETGMEGESGQLFGACKGAVMAFTKSLALSMAPEVRVNCLAPGWIRTAWGEQASAAWQERVRHETPLARWGTPEDVARTACWLVSPSAHFITGQMVRINGGAVRG